jgi:hypothetical protein
MAKLFQIGRPLRPRIHTVFTSSNGASTVRQDKPYLTQYGNISVGTSSIGKSVSSVAPSPNYGLNRYRIGFPIVIPNTGNELYDQSITPFSTVTFSITMNGYTNTLESPWHPQVYLSPTDDTALYAQSLPKSAWDWELVSGKTLIGDLTYGTTTAQTFTIPLATFLGLVPSGIGNVNICFIVGQNLDFANSGTGGTGRTTNDALATLSNCSITIS